MRKPALDLSDIVRNLLDRAERSLGWFRVHFYSWSRSEGFTIAGDIDLR